MEKSQLVKESNNKSNTNSNQESKGVSWTEVVTMGVMIVGAVFGVRVSRATERAEDARRESYRRGGGPSRSYDKGPKK